MIKAAIFDMDGLLIDSERIIMQGCIEAAASIGITYTEQQYVQLVGRIWSDSSRIMAEQLNGEHHMQQVIAGLNTFLDARNHVFPLKTGVLELLQFYRDAGVICSVASSSPIPHITHRLSHTGVLDYFDHITSGQEVQRGKPNPDIYLLALEKLGLQADECIAFEDSELGAQAAIAAGLRVIVVPDLKQPGDLVRAQAFHVVESLQHWHQNHEVMMGCIPNAAAVA
ncbi:HAD family hydrolase [Methylophilus sp. 3sh_L]|uniref:HAD family hydrolase n=1 Tax=Methylophilus sp. 3sh_L TaxID=3377114 RepID=UPI00398F0A2F